MKKKKGLIIGITAAVLLAASGVGLYFLLRNGKEEDKGRLVYVEKVGDLAGEYLGLDSRFMGIVESQETTAVDKDPEREVKDILVKVGDTVKVGDPLFTYDLEQSEMALEQKELELESMQNSINSDYKQVEELKKLQKNSSGDERLNYTSQIKSMLAKIKEDEYNLSLKKLEFERMQEGIGESVVTAPVDGVIRKIDENGGSKGGGGEYYGGYYGGSTGESGFITIMAVGDYRIKGTVTEMNVHSLYQGMPMVVRSRVDAGMIWKGSISKIEQEPVQNGSDYYYVYGGGDSASKYNFYVNLESSDGLMIGQHLYIEPDFGQTEVKDGLYLPSYYLVEDQGAYYVWKSVDEKITRTKVETGEYDENQDSREIVSGLTREEYIAFPDPSIVEGSRTTTNYSEIQEQENPGILPDGTDNGKEDPGEDVIDLPVETGVYEPVENVIDLPEETGVVEPGKNVIDLPEETGVVEPDGNMSIMPVENDQMAIPEGAGVMQTDDAAETSPAVREGGN